MLYAHTTELRHGTHLVTAYFSTKKGNLAIVHVRMEPKLHDKSLNGKIRNELHDKSLNGTNKKCHVTVNDPNQGTMLYLAVI